VIFIEVLAALRRAFLDRNSLAEFTRITFNVQLNHITSENSNLIDTTFELSSWCESQGNLDTLISALKARGASSHNNSFFDLCLGEDNIFLNRTELRNALSAIEDNNSSRTLLVLSGQRGMGHSHTLQLLKHNAIRYNFQLVYTDLRDIPEAEITGEPVALELLRAVNAPEENMPPRNQNSPNGWSRSLAIWTAGKLRNTVKTGKWWFIVDSVCDTNVHEEVRGFLLHLAKRFNSDMGPNARLAMLGYNALLLPDFREIAQEVSLRDIAATDIENFLRTLFNERQETVPDDTLKSVASDIETKLPPLPDDSNPEEEKAKQRKARLRQLHDELVKYPRLPKLGGNL
jgi:hypothetical protein